jgi:hypothetical protein
MDRDHERSSQANALVLERDAGVLERMKVEKWQEHVKIRIYFNCKVNQFSDKSLGSKKE